jgi:type II secretory pathway component PulF
METQIGLGYSVGMNSTTALNQVAELLRSNGVTPTKEMVFTIALGTLVKAGTPVRDAFDMVFGAGSYVRAAGNLQAALATETR